MPLRFLGETGGCFPRRRASPGEKVAEGRMGLRMAPPIFAR
jgi:hypothetical protein